MFLAKTKIQLISTDYRTNIQTWRP